MCTSIRSEFNVIASLVLLSLLTIDAAKSPNILVIIADDLGYGDVGCFGNTTLRTPNIDKLASQGVKLTHHLTSASLCTPSRTALLTGRYQTRSGMVSSMIAGVLLFLASSSGLPSSEITFADIAKKKGYNTGLIGKWHLGWNEAKYNDSVHHPSSFGFDYYYGHPLTNMRDWGNEDSRVFDTQWPNARRQVLGSFILLLIPLLVLWKKEYIGLKLMLPPLLLFCLIWGYIFFIFANMVLFNSVLYRNFDIVEQPINLETLSERYTKESIEFIENKYSSKQPFLLVVSFDHVHTALFTTQQFRGVSKHGRYGDAVEELDYGTGQILSTLDRLGIANETFVYFTSDNGGHLEEIGVNGEIDGGYNGPFRGGKGHASVDGGIRVPSIVRYGNRIPANTVSDVPTTQMDMFTTISSLLNEEVPQDRIIDGQNIMPVLKGETNRSPSKFLYHYCNDEITAMRFIPERGEKVWKLVFKVPDYMPGTTMCSGLACLCRNVIKLDPPVFYEMTSDPGEQHPIPISTDDEYQQMAEMMVQKLDDHVKSIGHVDTQMTLRRAMWNPFLQPCCNFPACKCSDHKYR